MNIGSPPSLVKALNPHVRADMMQETLNASEEGDGPKTPLEIPEPRWPSMQGRAP